MTCTYPSCACIEVHSFIKRTEVLAARLMVDFGPDRGARLASNICDYHRQWEKAVDTTDRCQGSNFNIRGWGKS